LTLGWPGPLGVGRLLTSSIPSSALGTTISHGLSAVSSRRLSRRRSTEVTRLTSELTYGSIIVSSNSRRIANALPALTAILREVAGRGLGESRPLSALRTEALLRRIERGRARGFVLTPL
jgi:hypothetical protein